MTPLVNTPYAGDRLDSRSPLLPNPSPSSPGRSWGNPFSGSESSRDNNEAVSKLESFAILALLNRGELSLPFVLVALPLVLFLLASIERLGPSGIPV
jgi:hypothetical protein